MKLVIEDETGTRSIVPFVKDEITVGRAADGNSFRLPERDVSRRHARFALSSGVAFVEDLGSLTGTRVNGERITGRRRLRDGDLVEIGDYDLAVVADDGVAAVAGPGAPPPLPPAPRPPGAEPPRAGPSARAAVPGPAPAEPTSSQPRPRLAAQAGSRRAWLLAGIAAVALGLALGYAAGAFTRPASSAVQRADGVPDRPG
jgi:hypothetical protein